MMLLVLSLSESKLFISDFEREDFAMPNEFRNLCRHVTGSHFASQKLEYARLEMFLP